LAVAHAQAWRAAQSAGAPAASGYLAVPLLCVAVSVAMTVLWILDPGQLDAWPARPFEAVRAFSGDSAAGVAAGGGEGRAPRVVALVVALALGRLGAGPAGAGARRRPLGRSGVALWRAAAEFPTRIGRGLDLLGQLIE